MSKQAWTITTTPRARLQLAILLLHRDLKIRGRADEKRLYRARQALGLLGISESVLKHNYELGTNRYQHDGTTRHAFVITIETAEWILRTIEPLELNTAMAFYLEPLLEQLEAQADAADADTAEPFDEQAEIPRWEPRFLAAPPDDDEPQPADDQADEPAPEDEPPPPPPRDDDRPAPEPMQLA